MVSNVSGFGPTRTTQDIIRGRLEKRQEVRKEMEYRDLLKKEKMDN